MGVGRQCVNDVLTSPRLCKQMNIIMSSKVNTCKPQRKELQPQNTRLWDGDHPAGGGGVVTYYCLPPIDCENKSGML